MNINREELVELLVQRTGLKKEQVEEQLSKLISEIHETADTGERFTIPRFGSFYTEDDKLHFEPAESLETEVNNKYAGMEPIELIGACGQSEETSPLLGDTGQEEQEQEPEPEISKDIWPDEEDIWGWDEENIPEQEPEIVMESEEEAESPEELAGSDTPNGDDKGDEAARESEPEETESTAEPEIDDEGATPSPQVEPTIESTVKAKKEKLRHGQKKTSSTPLIIVAAAMVIAIAVSAWFIFDLSVSSDQGLAEEEIGATKTTPAQQQQQTQQQSPADMGDEAAEAPPPSGSQDSEPSGDNAVADNDRDQQTASVYGLKGNLQSEANDGYTIVILSMKDRQRAKEMYDTMNQKGFRTLMVSAIVGGEKFWRVALGQFETIPDAQKHARNLPEPYSENFFIKSIL
ncbi:MAG: SPOR domain-containing protein [Balneolaceae bacterium]|nr:SPOR domain-containing protein [Balneolaceae bacterium]